MCGINGFNWTDEELIKKMNEVIRHRGPDDEGIYVNKDVSLGHVRLSIIDLSEKGHQPMMDSAGEVIIVYNGEIYNFIEIRNELSKKGYSFKTKTDTEVILYAYKEWGFDCVKRFDGMWAFAIYDKRKQLMFLSRDRLGIKPLYYFRDEKNFIFSSEMKGIAEVKKINIKKNINKDAVTLYFALGFIPAPYSIYKNVYKVEPHQNLIFDLRNKKIKKWYYWNLPRYDPVYAKKKLIEKGKKLFYDAVRLRMRSDVPVGAFLSGGLDSSSVVGIMKEYTNLRMLHTFSIGFEKKYDETKYMNIVVNKFHTRHHHYKYKKEDFERFISEKYAEVYDEPLGDPSAMPTYKVSEMANKFVTVALGGDGGDEVFGGYTRHLYAYRIDKIKKIPRPIRSVLFYLIPELPKFHKLKEGMEMSLAKSEELYSKLFSRGFLENTVYDAWIYEKMKVLMRTSNYKFGEAVRIFDLLYRLPEAYLVKTDRASMANSLEVRSPFLDHRFAELSQRIPLEWKVDSFKTKKLMRKIIKDIVPKEILFRGKQGFTPPINEWIFEKKYLDKIFKKTEILKDLAPEIYDFFENKVFVDINRKENRKYLIRLLLFLHWWEKWMES